MDQPDERSEQTQDNNSPDKISREFNGAIKKLVAILGSDRALNPTSKVKFDDLTIVVKELLQEEADKNAKEISEQLKALLKGHADLKAEVNKKKKELEQLEQNKMKEFTKAAKQLFARVEELDKKEKEYYSALAAASTTSTEDNQQ